MTETIMPGMDKPPQRSANRQIARAAGTVMAAIIISQLVGMLAKILTARSFGTGADSEAFFAANRFAEILFNLVAGGALGSAFIPAFTGLLAKGERRQAWKLASAIANLVSLVLLCVSVAAAVFAEAVVRYILAPGFTDPQLQSLTASLLRIQLLSSIIFGLSGLIMGILNAHQIFLFPALAPAMYSLGWIFGALVLAPRLGIHGLAWGVVIGAALHLLIQLPVALRLPERVFTLTLELRDAAVREVGRLMAPRLLGVAVVQLNFLLNTYLASLQPEGSLTGISYAFPLMIMPQAAIAQSAAIAALPTFSAQAALGKLDEMRASLAATLRGVLLLAIPASVGLILLREPLVALIYQRGEFTAESTRLVAWALLWYAAGLVGHSVVEVVSRAFYALHDTRTPVGVGVAAMTLNLGFSLFFSTLFQQAGWAPHGGLALANSLATTLEMAGLLFLMRRRLGGLQGATIVSGVFKAVLASMGMGLVIWLLAAWLASAPVWILASLGLGSGVLMYTILCRLLKVNEVNLVLSYLTRRLAARWR